MKILITHLKPLKNIGGIETYGVNLINNLKGDIYFLHSKRNHSNKIRKEKIGNKIVKVLEYEMPWVSVNKKYQYPILHQKAYSDKLKEFINCYGDFDLIICLHSIFPEPSSKVSKGKIIFIMPSCNRAWFKKIKNEAPKEEAKTWKIHIKIERRILANPKIKVIILSKFMKQLLKKSYPKINAKLKVVYPGVAVKLRYQKKTLDVLSVARLDPIKNFPAFLKVASILPNRKFIIVGEGLDRQRLEKIISEKDIRNVRLVGGKKDPSNYYASAKVFVLTSKYESFGLVLIEAMAYGLPCIAFKPNGKKIETASKEIIKNGETGFLVKDEKEMASKITLLLNDGRLRERLGINARKEARKYNWKKTCRSLLL